MTKKLDKIFKKTKKLKIDDNTKIVIMSDCHRGAGNNYDNFLKNQTLYEAALFYYYNNDFTYIELGDGDELWEVSDCNDIINVHIDSFKQLKKFNDNNKLFMIYGNHDISKSKKEFVEQYFYKYYDKETKKEEDLLNGLIVYESLILDYYGYEMFLIHGHQVDFFNSTFWKLSRFLVKNVWKKLESTGIKDPTSAAKNYQVSKSVEKKLKRWSVDNNKILIAGHTHRSIFPKDDESLYFNDGSCIHPNGLTCIEIENGKITLAKWNYIVDKELISVGRRVLEGEESIINFYNKKRKK